MGWRLGSTDGSFGRYQNVEVQGSGSERVYAAAADPRADGAGLAY
jgi:gamma-glutamyltranspeptidase